MHDTTAQRSTARSFAFVILAIAVAIVIYFAWPTNMLLHPKRHQAAKWTQCHYNLRQVMLALHNYASVNNGHMPSPGYESGDLSWRVQILPLIDQAALYRSYHRDKSWNDPANDEYAKMPIPVYQCPSNPRQRDPQGRFYSAFALLTGPGTTFDGPDQKSLDDLGMGKGLTQTMLLGEACGANIVWNEPRDIDVAREQPGVNLPGQSRGSSSGWLSTNHVDGASIAFADGSVKTVSTKIDPAVLKALVSIDEKIRLPRDKLP